MLHSVNIINGLSLKEGDTLMSNRPLILRNSRGFFVKGEESPAHEILLDLTELATPKHPSLNNKMCYGAT